MTMIDFLIYAAGFICVGMIAGMAIGTALERRRQVNVMVRPRRPIVLTKRDAEEILEGSKFYRDLARISNNGRSRQ